MRPICAVCGWVWERDIDGRKSNWDRQTEKEKRRERETDRERERERERHTHKEKERNKRIKVKKLETGKMKVFFWGFSKD